MEIFVAIVVGLVSVVAGGLQIYRHFRPEPALLPTPLTHAVAVARANVPQKPLSVEIIAISFDVSLSNNVPQAGVQMRAINYLGKTVSVDDVVVTLHVAGCASFDRLGLVVRVDLPARRSRELFCRRPLVESEIKLLRSCLTGTGPFEGTVLISGNARTGKKTVPFHSVLAQHVRGWITGLS